MRPAERDNNVITCPGFLGCSMWDFPCQKKASDCDSFSHFGIVQKKKMCGLFVLYSKQEITIYLQIKNFKNNLLSNFSQLSIHTSSQKNFP